jgi:hypothetical protein
MNKGRCINEGQVWFGFILWQLWKAALGHALIWLGATHASLPDLVGQRVPVTLSCVIFFLFLTTCFIFLVTGVLLILSTSFDLLYDR